MALEILGEMVDLARGGVRDRRDLWLVLAKLLAGSSNGLRDLFDGMGDLVLRGRGLCLDGLPRLIRDIARGNELALHLQVTEAFSGTATGLDTAIVASDDDDSGFFLTNLVNLTKWTNITDLLTLNAEFTIPLSAIPRHMLDLVVGATGRRYMGVLYTALGGGTYDTGRVTAYFGHWRDTTRPTIYKSGYTGP